MKPTKQAVDAATDARRRKTKIFCGYDGHVWTAVVPASHERYGHVCPQCSRPTGFEP